MTIIIDNVAITEKLEPLFKILIISLCTVLFYMFVKILADFFQDRNKRERKKNAKILYTKRKRQFEGDKIGWKKWRDANYKITDLLKGDTYY